MKKIDFMTRIRFPVIFGSFLLLTYFGFSNRHIFMSDIEEKRAVLFPVNQENKEILEAFKKTR